MISPELLVVGAVMGLGIALVVRAVIGDVPDLSDSLARLSDQGSTPYLGERRVAQPGGGWDRGGWHSSGWHSSGWRREVATTFHLDRFAADLAILGESVEALVTRKIAYALLGLAFPAVLGASMVMLGAAMPWEVPAGAGLLLALLLFFAPDIDVHRRAEAARVEFRYCICTYLELVALERAADAGTAESLSRAAQIGGARPFILIRDALARAVLAGAPSWSGLRTLSDDLRVPELADIADIMRLSGEDGAAVYTTLRARATSMRTALLSESAAAANAASEHMVVPVALLGIAFMVLIGYPAFARIVFG